MDKTGELKVIASTGGLKLSGSDEWLNPADKVTSTGIDYLKGLKGRQVVLKFNSNEKYTGCEPAGSASGGAAPVTNTAQAYPHNRDRSIIRQSCLKVAAEVLKASRVEDRADIKDLSDQTLALAGRFEDWVNRA